MVQELGQCSHAMVDLDDPAPGSSSCLDDDRALALVDGQLSLEAREQIEAHLDRCAACRRFVSELAKESLFQSPTELPTDLERTGYAPGRPGLLDVAFTVRDLAATRVGVPDPEARAEVLAPPKAVRARAAEPPRVASPAPLTSDERSRPAATSRTGARGLDRTLVVVLVVTLLVFVLSAFAALLSLGAFGYVFFHS